MAKENFTNESGYYADKRDCSTLTLKDCLSTATCGWCMKDDSTAYCTAGTYQGPDNGTCQKWYHNDVYTRAALSNDADYLKYIDRTIVE